MKQNAGDMMRAGRKQFNESELKRLEEVMAGKKRLSWKRPNMGGTAMSSVVSLEEREDFKELMRQRHGDVSKAWDRISRQ